MLGKIQIQMTQRITYLSTYLVTMLYQKHRVQKLDGLYYVNKKDFIIMHVNLKLKSIETRLFPHRTLNHLHTKQRNRNFRSIKQQTSRECFYKKQQLHFSVI